MKKLLTALTITLASVAFAEDPAKQQKEQNAATAAEKKSEIKAEAERTGKTETQVQAQAEGKQVDEEGIEATDVGGQLKENSKEWARQAGLVGDKDPKQKAMWKQTKQAFNVNGTVKGKPGGEVELTRQGLPDVKLDIRDETVVMLDGKKIEARYLPEGSQVRASFQLDGDDPVALKITARSSKGAKGVGGSGLEEQEDKGLIGAEEVGPKAKDAAKDVGDAVENTAEDAKDAVDDK